jgi:low affinity Fe/Cu permease
MPGTDKHSRAGSKHGHTESFFARLARGATDWSGTSAAFFAAIVLIVVWAASRPLFENFDTWQLVINTLTTIITFLMVFLIQRAQNKDSQAIHLKLNELVAAVEGASNRLINAESLSEEELKVLHTHYGKLIELARQDESITECHSVEDAVDRHRRKHKKDSTKESKPFPSKG